jgi:hypothetical protein
MLTRDDFTVTAQHFYSDSYKGGKVSYFYIKLGDKLLKTCPSEKAVEKAFPAIIARQNMLAEKKAERARAERAAAEARGTVFGECQICEREQALSKDGLLVNHGYTRPGCGFIVGNCYGVKYPTYAKSCERLTQYHAMVLYIIEDKKDSLAGVDSRSELSEKVNDRTKPLGYGRYEQKTIYHANGTREFAALAKILKARLESEIKHAEYELERAAKRIAAWKPEE